MALFKIGQAPEKRSRIMAHVDLSTGKIYGCAPGSLTWLHEKGHLAYARKSWAPRLAFSRVNFQDLTIVFLALAVFFNWWPWKLAALLTATAWTGLYFFEEAWAWFYALRKKGFI